jgi:hypothetical protein
VAGIADEGEVVIPGRLAPPARQPQPGDAVVRLSSMPLAATGKIDKIRLRLSHSGN